MAKKARKSNGVNTDLSIDSYKHTDKTRKNNPPVGLVSAENDGVSTKKTYNYDPHNDPQLDWAGKSEHLSFEIDTVSLHVHERIDPYSIIERIKSEDENKQTNMFESPNEKLSQKAVIEFYKHEQNWTNRLIAGDSLLIMNSLLEKEGLAEKFQTIYIDPPYGVNYGSNFQPFFNNKVVKEQDENVTQDVECLKAFRDTWQLGIHSYLQYLRDRILLSHRLLNESGSCFIQISDENFHYVRRILDEVFGACNFIADIRYRTRTIPLSTKLIDVAYDHVLWFAKNKEKVKYRKLFKFQKAEGDQNYRYVELKNGERRKMNSEEHNNHSLLPEGSRVFAAIRMRPSQYRKNQDFNFKFEDKLYPPPGGNTSKTPNGIHSWSTTKEGMENLSKQNRLWVVADEIKYVLYHEDYPITPYNSIWDDTASEKDKLYVVQTSSEVVRRCILMSSDPGDLILDPTCGSGTTAYICEKYGRRWITCDSSRVAVIIARQRILTSVFDFYKLKNPNDGIGGGLEYRVVPHITLGALANNEPQLKEVLVDSPIIDKNKLRVSGPFTVEAVPAPSVKSIEENETTDSIDLSIARSSGNLKHIEWKDELLKTGIRGKNGQKIHFSRVETLPGTKHLHAEAETNEVIPMRVAFSFGQEHIPLDQIQVQLALEEATTLVPKPKMVCFCSFHFDPEASKDIDEINWPGVQILKVQMNIDLLTKDLKKKQSSSDSFFFIGSPDIIVKKGKDDRFSIEVNGFDYYNVKTGEVESGDNKRIAMWMIDTDYDGRSLLPSQVFFPMAGDNDGWERLSKNLKAALDDDRLEAFKGAVSLPFTRGKYGRAAVKIVDDRGIESLKIVELK